MNDRLSKTDKANESYKLYTITEFINDTKSSFHKIILPGTHNEALPIKTETTMTEKEKVMKRLRLFQNKKTLTVTAKWYYFNFQG